MPALIIRYRAALLLCALFVLCALLYWPALHGPFLFDDFPNLNALTSIDALDSWRDLGIYLSQAHDFPGRPLAMLSFLPQQASWPNDPFPFKLVNLLIHLFNGWLVYRLVLALARVRGLQEQASLAALLACAAWLLNPIQSSAILLVVQRMTLLMASFVLFGLLAYLKALEMETAVSRRRGAWMLLGLGVCMSLSFLSKENGILLPLYALLLDVTLLRGSVARLPRPLLWWRRLLIWPVVIFVVVYLVHEAWRLGLGFHGSRHFTLAERLLTEPRILLDYLGKILLPQFGGYGLYHDGYPFSHGWLTPWTTLPALVLVLAAALGGWSVRKRWPLLALALLWYLGGQLIESSSVMLELYFEHRNYVPIIGGCAALGLALAGLNREWRRLALLLFGAWLLACAFTLVLTAKTYSSEDRLAAVWASSQPDSIRAQNMLAGQLFAHGQLQLSLGVLEKALVAHPDAAGLNDNLVYVKCMQGSLEATDVDQLERVLAEAPFSIQGYQSLDTLRAVADAGSCKALTVTRWIKLVNTLLHNPHYQNASALGFLHYQLHEQAVADGNLGRALEELDITFGYNPDPELPRLQAKYLMSAGLYDQAVARLKHYPYARLPLLRRLLVNDHAINEEAIQAIRKKQQTESHQK